LSLPILSVSYKPDSRALYLRTAAEETAALRLASNAPPSNPTKKTKAAKPLLLSDFQRQALLDSASAGGPSEHQPLPPTHAEEQEALRLETLNAFKVDYGDAGDDESGGLFSVRKDANAGDEDMEDEEYRTFLLGSGGGEEGIREALGLGKKAADQARTDEQDGDASEDEDVGEKADGEADGEEPAEGAEGEKKKRKRVKRKPKVKVPMTEEEKKQKDEEFLLE
jgi:protein KRI1